MRIHVADHPLIAHKLTTLRDERTDSPTFRGLADELVTLLAYEATRDVRVEHVTVTTPVADAEGIKLATPKPLVVPILRAGLGMLNGMMRLLPTAEVGFLGMVRNEETLEASTYAERLPEDVGRRRHGRRCARRSRHRSRRHGRRNLVLRGAACSDRPDNRVGGHRQHLWMLGELRDVFAVDKGSQRVAIGLVADDVAVVGQGFPDLAPMAGRGHHDDSLGRRTLPERGAERAVYF